MLGEDYTTVNSRKLEDGQETVYAELPFVYLWPKIIMAPWSLLYESRLSFGLRGTLKPSKLNHNPWGDR